MMTKEKQVSQIVKQSSKKTTLNALGSKDNDSNFALISKIDDSSFENDGNGIIDEDEEDQDMDDMVADETESRPSLNSNAHADSAAKLTGIVRHSETSQQMKQKRKFG